jgi:hypothetical protein
MAITILNATTTTFTLNGIEYQKNFQSIVNGDNIKITNVYDSKQVLVDSTIYSDFIVDGNTYASATLLQGALVDILFDSYYIEFDNRITTTENDIEALYAGQTGGLKSFTTLALLEAYATPNINDSYKVTNDPDPANNGYYHWVSGTTYVKDYDLANGVVESGNVDAVSGGKVFDVTSNKADLVVAGKNLFDKSAITDNFYIDNLGNTYASGSYFYSDFIKVDVGQQYTLSYICRYYTFYDINKNYVSGGGVVDTFTIPSGVAYVIVSGYDTTQDIWQLEKGSISTTYEAFKLAVDNNQLNISETINNTSTLPVASKTIYDTLQLKASLEVGKNLFDKSAVTVGYYMGENGVSGASATYDYSDYIAVIPGQNLVSNNTMRFTSFYDENKTFVSGGSGSATKNITIPSGVYYVIVTVFATDLDIFQLEIGTIATAFEPYVLGISKNQRIDAAPRLILPKRIDAVLGETIQLFWRGLIESVNPYQWNIKVTGTVNGDVYPRFYEYTPDTSGEKTITISLYDDDDNLITQNTTIIQVSVKKTTLTTTKVLCIGDSLTNAGIWTDEFRRMIHDTGGTPNGLGLTNFSLIGTQGVAPNLREGYSGMTWEFFTTATSPFWNSSLGRLDFTKYVTDNGFGTIDFNYVLLTWNGLTTGLKNAEDHAGLIADAKIYINQLHSDFPNCKIKLMGVPLPDNTGGIDGNNSVYYNNYYGLCQTVNGLNLAYQQLANDSSYSSFVEFVNVSTQFDNEYNYPYLDVQVNSRNPITEKRGGNSGIHPSPEGYYQIADVAFRNFNAS